MYPVTLGMLLFIALAPSVSAQEATQTSAAPVADSREAELANRQAVKQQNLAPYRLGRVEKFLTDFEANLFKTSRLAVNFGPMLHGAGMRLGMGYITHFGDRVLFIGRGAYSLKHYKTISAELFSPGHLNDHVDLEVGVGWRDAPRMAFSGVGNDSLRSNRTNFLLQEGWARGNARVRPTAWRPFSLAGDAQYLSYETGAGRGRTPSIETRFTRFDAPGLGLDPRYMRYAGEAAIDTRTGPGYSRSGTLLRAGIARYDDLDGARFDFDRVDLEATQLIPLLRHNWIIALHAEMASTTTDRGAVVPFFMLPSLGSGSSLRAYPSFRFRDRHSLLLSGEFRWTPNEALDAAIFYDAGKVAARRSGLDLDDLNTDFGFGVRFHGLTFTALRIEIAYGSEGPKLVFSTGQAW